LQQGPRPMTDWPLQRPVHSEKNIDEIAAD
jgi:hypothetical protein